MKNRRTYSESPYGQMRDRIKAKEEAEKKKTKARFPYRYLMNMYEN